MTTPATAATHDWRPSMTRRVAFVSVLLALWVAGIEAKLVYLQVFDRADLAARAERQQERTQPSPAKRGDILDRRGRLRDPHESAHGRDSRDGERADVQSECVS